MKHFLFFPLLVLVIACNTDKNIDPYSIYGYWESTDLGKDTANPIGLKLDLQDTCVAWIDPVVSDTIFFYNSCIIRNDSLVLQYNKNIKKFYIEKLTDFELVLKHAGRKYIYKRSAYYNDKPRPKYSLHNANSMSTDSLDVIIKSQSEFSQVGVGGFAISKDDMLRVRKIVSNFLNNEYKDNTFSFDSFNECFHQYIGERVTDTLYVHVVFFDSYYSRNIGYMALKESVMWNSGYYMKVDLTNNKVVYFRDYLPDI